MAGVQRVGLTGGLGSGKSTIAAILKKCGATLIDADAISRQLTACGGSAIPLIRSQFGASVLLADGSLDRKKMRTWVYAEPSARQRLENIIHPLVAIEIQRLTDLAREAGSGCVVFDIPLLVESGRWREQVDTVLVVDCSVATQIERVTRRDGMLEKDIKVILDAQTTREKRLRAADSVIFNDRMTLLELDHEVTQFTKALRLSSCQSEDIGKSA